MSTFKDSTGKEWTVRITVGSIRRVRESVGVDVRKLDSWNTMAADMEKLGSVIWALAGGPASGVTLDDFLDRLDGPAFAAAGEAFVTAAGDFFRMPQTAAAVLGKAESETATTDETAASMLSGGAGNSPGSAV